MSSPDAPSPSGSEQAEAAKRWRPLGRIDRRVVGVLVEKAKTTPDAYPMTLNGLKAGSNQKNNRDPVMELEEEDVEAALERLRAAGAVTLVQGAGRVQKYRHQMYEWLGVDKVEMAVMIELLLRGAQTEGELRGRASRMEPIDDLGVLRDVLQRLKARGLVIPLTPEGRGHIVTHALYESQELEKVRRELGSGATQPQVIAAVNAPPQMAPQVEAGPSGPRGAPPATTFSPVAGTRESGSSSAQSSGQLAAEQARMQDQIRRLETDVSQLKADFADAQSQLHTCQDEIRRLRSALGE